MKEQKNTLENWSYKKLTSWSEVLCNELKKWSLSHCEFCVPYRFLPSPFTHHFLSSFSSQTSSPSISSFLQYLSFLFFPGIFSVAPKDYCIDRTLHMLPSQIATLYLRLILDAIPNTSKLRNLQLNVCFKMMQNRPSLPTIKSQLIYLR